MTTPGNESGATPPGDDYERDAEARRLRRSALRFVVIFAVVTLTVLTLGRFAILTPFMNYYLFLVADQTATVLSLVGHSAQVEEPRLYRGREAEVRAETMAWQRGTDWDGDTSGVSAGPLTPFEIWNHRALLNKRQFEMLTVQYAATEPFPNLTASDLTQLARELVKWVDQLDAAIYQPNWRGPRATAPPGVADELEQYRKLLTQDDTYTEDALQSHAQALERLRAEQRRFLTDRLSHQAEICNGKLGPTVIFVAKAGMNTRIEEAANTLSEAQAASAGSQHIAQLQAELTALQEEMRATVREGGVLEQDVAFRFHLVPDCGAFPSMAIFAAAVLAFPALFWKRLAGVLIGVPFLYLVNILRLVCLALIGAWVDRPEVFNFTHEYVWQAIYLVFVVAVWLAWVELVVRPRKTWQRANPK